MFKKSRLISSLFFLVLTLFLSACSTKSKDILVDTSWIAEADSSYIIFNKDNGFKWHKSKDVQDDNYYEGTYSFYMGQEAMNYITETLPEYYITKENFQELFDKSEGLYELDNLVCLILNNEIFILEGEKQKTQIFVSNYYGFLIEEKTVLDMAKMNTAGHFLLIKE